MITQKTLTIQTKGRGFIDITRDVNALVHGHAAALCNVFVQHTSASLVVQENADPTVRSDLEGFLTRLIDDEPFEHTDEGPDDMPAHVKSALLKTSETIPVQSGKLMLGTWQALYLVEHRDSPHARRVVVTIYGASA